MTDPLILDQFLPAWDHEISVSQLFRAPPAEVFDAVTNLDLFRLPVARVLLGARALPGRLASAAARHRAGLRRGRPAVEGNGRLAAGAPGNRRDLRGLRRAGVRQAGGEHRGHPVRHRGVRADIGEPGDDDRRGQPAAVPALLASGGAVHPADAPGGDARPGAAVAARRLPQAGAMTPGKAARLRRLRGLNSPPRPVRPPRTSAAASSWASL